MGMADPARQDEPDLRAVPRESQSSAQPKPHPLPEGARLDMWQEIREWMIRYCIESAAKHGRL
jgi:hypothetical protein